MAGPAYLWDVWRFEPTECRLTRDGVLVPLPAKTLDLLSALLRRAPRLVTKEEILAAVWPDAAVEEGNIAFHVAALRKVLDEGGDTSAIETVRGRGYRFVHLIAIQQMPATDDMRLIAPAPPIVPAAAAAPSIVPAAAAAPLTAAPPARRLPAFAVAVLLLAAVAAGVGWFAWSRTQPVPLSIAVEPFEIINPSAGQENFPEGMGAYLTSRLERAGVTVAPHDTATARLSGQLQPTAAGFRVTVQLTQAADSARLWDWSFDQSADEERPDPSAGPDDERSRVQGKIAEHIADGLQRYLSLSGVAPVTR